MSNRHCLDLDSLLVEDARLPSNTQKKPNISPSHEGETSQEDEISKDIRGRVRCVRGYDVKCAGFAEYFRGIKHLPEIISIPGSVNYRDIYRGMYYVTRGEGAKAIDVKNFSPEGDKIVLERKKNDDDDSGRLDLVVEKTTAYLINFFDVNKNVDYYDNPLSFDLEELGIGGYDDERICLLYGPDQLVAASRRIKFLEDLTDRLTANLNDKFYYENGISLFDISIEGSRLVIKVSQPTFLDKLERIGMKGKDNLGVLTTYTNDVTGKFIKNSAIRGRSWLTAFARKVKTFLVNKGVLHDSEVE